MTYVWGALAGAVWGLLAALLNAWVTKKCLAKNSANAMLAANFVHTLVDIAALAAVFLARNVLPVNFAAAIVATAAALSMTTIIFAYKFAAPKDP